MVMVDANQEADKKDLDTFQAAADLLHKCTAADAAVVVLVQAA